MIMDGHHHQPETEMQSMRDLGERSNQHKNESSKNRGATSAKSKSQLTNDQKDDKVGGIMNFLQPDDFDDIFVDMGLPKAPEVELPPDTPQAKP